MVVVLSVGLLALERNILLMHPLHSTLATRKEPSDISKSTSFEACMTSWHLRIFGWEESGRSPGSERAGVGLSHSKHTCEASVIHESVMVPFFFFNFYFYSRVTVPHYFPHDLQFGPVFARGTKIRVIDVHEVFLTLFKNSAMCKGAT